MAKSTIILKQNGMVRVIGQPVNMLLDTLANGKYTLIIKKVTEKRSIDQNALMWLWLSCIERETGTDKNDIHDYYCALFLRRKVIINGQEKTIISGTSKLNKDQFTDFLNKVQADATQEFGIKLPNPDDLYFESFKAEYSRYINI